MDTVPAIHQAPLRADVVRLLESASLPTSDLSDDDMRDFFCAGPATAPVGIVGLQFYGSDALLRSLVVSSAHCARGLGHRLFEHAEHHAREHGATTVYLLTATAKPRRLAAALDTRTVIHSANELPTGGRSK